MAIGAAIGVALPYAIKYGIPAAIAAQKIIAGWLETLHANPNMSQAEYEEKYLAMQADLRETTNAHEALRRQGK